MRTLADVIEQFHYHPATPGPDGTAAKHAAVRQILADTAARLWVAVPDGPEKTLAIRKLQEAGMYANLAIALTAPLAQPGTEAVARVLPEPAAQLLAKVTGETTVTEVVVHNMRGDEVVRHPAELPLGGLPVADGCGACQIPCGVCR
jgi:hypothetical protein